MAEVHTSDDLPRPNANAEGPQPLAQPAAPTLTYDVDDNARVIALNQLGTYANALNTYWAGAITPTVAVIDPSAGYPHNDVVSRINLIIAMQSALIAKFPAQFSSITPLPTYISLDYNAFTSAISTIAAKWAAMATAKP